MEAEEQQRRSRGRPRIAPEETSIQVKASIQMSLYQRLHRLAKLRQETEAETIRAALREFISKKLPDTHHYS